MKYITIILLTLTLSSCAYTPPPAPLPSMERKDFTSLNDEYIYVPVIKKNTVYVEVGK